MFPLFLRHRRVLQFLSYLGNTKDGSKSVFPHPQSGDTHFGYPRLIADGVGTQPISLNPPKSQTDEITPSTQLHSRSSAKYMHPGGSLDAEILRFSEESLPAVDRRRLNYRVLKYLTFLSPSTSFAVPRTSILYFFFFLIFLKACLFLLMDCQALNFFIFLALVFNL